MTSSYTPSKGSEAAWFFDQWSADVIETLRRELAASGDRQTAYIAEIKCLDDEITATQAREKVLRDALVTLSNHYPDAETRAECERVRDMVDTALAQPADDTALRGLLEHENSVWYSALGPNYVDFDPVGAVRAFEAQVKLEAMCEMERYHDTALKAALANERERYKKAFQKMRNVAAVYSNHCEDNGSTRRLEREFTEAEKIFSTLGD